MKQTRHKDKIIALRAEGKTYSEIQKELNCSTGTIAYHVGEGQKEKTIERGNNLRRRRLGILRKIKEESGCVDCGGKFHHFILEFDHLPGYEKIGSPTEIILYAGVEKALEEVAKCDIVCANCHKARTWSRANYVE